jgi:hypothetical protein
MHGQKKHKKPTVFVITVTKPHEVESSEYFEVVAFLENLQIANIRALVLYVFMSLVSSPKRTNSSTNKCNTNSYFITITIIIIIIGSTALGGP